MDDGLKTDIKKNLLDDDEFIQLIEKEAASDVGPSDGLAQQRVWQRLQTTLRSQAATAQKAPRAPWVAAAMIVIGIGGVSLLLKKPVDDQLKSGGDTSSSVSLQLARDDRGLQIKLQGLAPSQSIALVRDARPPAILWQGAASQWTEPFLLSGAPAQRICLLEAANAEALIQRLKLINDLQQLPADAPCVDTGPSSPQP